LIQLACQQAQFVWKYTWKFMLIFYVANCLLIFLPVNYNDVYLVQLQCYLCGSTPTLRNQSITMTIFRFYFFSSINSFYFQVLFFFFYIIY
jgi:hypothetical protein